MNIPIPSDELAERLRHARARIGLTQEAAATALGLARTTLVAIERSQRRVKPEELLAFAELYQTSVSRLISPEAVQVKLAAKFRRLDEREAGPEVLAAVDTLAQLGAGAAELERRLGRAPRRDYPPVVRLRPSGILQQAEDAALSLRARLGIGQARVDDLYALVENELGIHVFDRKLPGRVSGLYAFDEAIGACILINSSHPWKRRVQTLAHELGHFVVDRAHADVYNEDEIAASVEERFAKRFGPALLMPASAVRTRFGEISDSDQAFKVRHLVLLAHQFGVATEAMSGRLEELKLLPMGTWESLRSRNMSSSIEREVIGFPASSRAPAPVSPRVAYLAVEGIDRGVYTEGQLCDLLLLDRTELRQVLNPFLPPDEDEIC